MCGVVAFFGQTNGIEKVVGALNLLQYRAPDSTGIATFDSQGRLALRRCVGPASRLAHLLLEQPINLPPADASGPDSPQIVIGHGRWALVGAVTAENAHPLPDRGGCRLVAENGSHNAALMMRIRDEQEAYWRRQGVPSDQPVHVSENSTELIACEWERMARRLADGQPPPHSRPFLERLDASGIVDEEERALRLAMWRLREGNSHAAALHSRHRPGTLYVSSHNKPIAIARRAVPLPSGGSRHELMVASDINAALTLWPAEEIAAAARRIRRLRESKLPAGQLDAEIEAAKAAFTLDVLYLDQSVAGGEQILVSISRQPEEGGFLPLIQVSRYDGTPVAAQFQSVRLTPVTAQDTSNGSFAESHIAELPGVLSAIIARSRRADTFQPPDRWRLPGLRRDRLRQGFGPAMARLNRIILLGEGSSRQIALAAAPLFRRLLPAVEIIIARPSDILNQGMPLDAAGDLIIEISWSGSTDSLRMVDDWAAAHGVLRLAITGRPDSDLGRRAAESAGAVDTLTGLELSIPSVKGYPAGLLTAFLTAAQLAAMAAGSLPMGQEMSGALQEIPGRIAAMIADTARQRQVHAAAQRASGCAAVLLVGDSPVPGEAALKFQGLAQLMALSLPFGDPGLAPLLRRSAAAGTSLLIINATTPGACRQAEPLLQIAAGGNQLCVVQTIDACWAAPWRDHPDVILFELPHIDPLLQPLLDALFYYQLAVALAYARALSPDQIDRPRNLAKSVTTSSAEPREALERRLTDKFISVSQFAAQPPAAGPAADSPLASDLTAAFHAGIDAGRGMGLSQCRRLRLTSADPAARLGARMAAAGWGALTGGHLTGSGGRKISAAIRIEPHSGTLSWDPDGLLRLPADRPPWVREQLSMLFLIGMGITAAGESFAEAAAWEAAVGKSIALSAAASVDSAAIEPLRAAAAPRIRAGCDKIFVIGGGQDYLAAQSIAAALRASGWLAAPLPVDGVGHGPLAVLGRREPERDIVTLLLACDPLFQPGALVDAQVLACRQAPTILLVPQGDQTLPALSGVGAEAFIALPRLPRQLQPLVGASWGALLAAQLNSFLPPSGSFRPAAKLDDTNE